MVVHDVNDKSIFYRRLLEYIEKFTEDPVYNDIVQFSG